MARARGVGQRVTNGLCKTPKSGHGRGQGSVCTGGFMAYDSWSFRVDTKARMFLTHMFIQGEVFQ